MSSFRLRRAEAGDAGAVSALVAALDELLLGSSDSTLADLEDEWRQLDPQNRFVVDDGGAVVGYGTIEEASLHGRADGYVHPEHLGRGVGAFLVGELERALAARGATRVQNATLLADTRAQRLLAERGYAVIRRFWQMRVELAREPPAPHWPEGLSVCRFDPGAAGLFHRAYESAFADHWQHAPQSLEQWRQQYVEADDFTPALWAVVRAGDEIVAGTICRPERMGAGWIARLFTRRDWRRRGIGEALLHDAFRGFWQAGKRTVGLGVDAQSETGAHRLYERVGMHVHWAAVVFEKELG
jgi:mycothiol synthase